MPLKGREKCQRCSFYFQMIRRSNLQAAELHVL